MVVTPLSVPALPLVTEVGDTGTATAQLQLTEGTTVPEPTRSGATHTPAQVRWNFFFLK